MNSEHLIKYKKTNYGMSYYSNTEYKYEIPLFNGILYFNYIANFNSTMKSYEDIVIKIKNNNDKIIDTFIKNNQIWFTLENNKKTYNISVRAYSRSFNKSQEFKKIVDNNGHILLSKYISAKDKVLINFNCGHQSNWITPNSYLNGIRCPICAKNNTFPYINDIYTLHKDMLKYFVDENDSIGLGLSDKKMNFKCPICGTIKYTSPRMIHDFGFSCPICSDGISTPEKIMCNILNQLKIQYKTHVYFDWCNYIINGKNYRGIYDFVINDKKQIIEMDGSQHYEITHCFNQDGLEISKEKDRQKEILAIKNGYTLYRIDCNYLSHNRFEYIKQSIINSQLFTELQLSMIDWDEIHKNSFKSTYIDILNLWNNGCSINMIKNQLKYDRHKISRVLKEYNSIGLCDYNVAESKKRMGKESASKKYQYIKVLDNNTNKTIGAFWDTDIFIDNFRMNYPNKNITKSKILNVIKTNKKSIKNLSFVIIKKAEYIELLNNTELITDNNAGINSIYL